MPTYPDDLSVLFFWEIASKRFTQEMVSINLLFDCSIIKHFTLILCRYFTYLKGAQALGSFGGCQE